MRTGFASGCVVVMMNSQRTVLKLFQTVVSRVLLWRSCYLQKLRALLVRLEQEKLAQLYQQGNCAFCFRTFD
jgi:hypothetical protein